MTVDETQAYVLYIDPNAEIYAVGPFLSKEAAKTWMSGFQRASEGSDTTPIGIAEGFEPSDAVNVERP